MRGPSTSDQPHHCIDLNNYELPAHYLTAVSVCTGHQRATSVADCVSQVPFHPATARLWSLSSPYNFIISSHSLHPHSTFPVTSTWPRLLSMKVHAHSLLTILRCKSLCIAAGLEGEIVGIGHTHPVCGVFFISRFVRDPPYIATLPLHI